MWENKTPERRKRSSQAFSGECNRSSQRKTRQQGQLAGFWFYLKPVKFVRQIMNKFRICRTIPQAIAKRPKQILPFVLRRSLYQS